jgi:hypothetical protein
MSEKLTTGDRSQLSVAVAIPVFDGNVLSLHSIEISGGQMMTGSVLSSMVMDCVQVLLIPGLTVAVHVRIIVDSCGQSPVTTESEKVNVEGRPQELVAVAVPVLVGNVLSSHSIVTFSGHAITGGVGGVTITTRLHVLLHPFTSVIVTEYVPARIAVMQIVVSPVFHKYEAAPGVTQSSVDSPSQKMALPVIVHVGRGLTMTVLLHTLEHPFSSVTVTVYSPSWSTVMQLVTSPVLHRYELPVRKGVHSSLDSPSQRTLSPVMGHSGGGLTTTVLLHMLEHPFSSVTVTV